MFVYWQDTHSKGWQLLSGVLLCITGVEAMYADLGHFSRRAVQVLILLLAEYAYSHWNTEQMTCVQNQSLTGLPCVLTAHQRHAHMRRAAMVVV